MKNSENILISELEDSLRQKIKLLKNVNTAYSNSIDLIESKKHKELLKKLDEQKMMLDQIDKVDNLINTSLKKNGILKSEILNGSYDNSQKLCSIVKFMKETEKLLKSTRTLNQKLSYKVDNARAEIKQNMAEAKNRRLILSGYRKSGQQKTGLLFDYKQKGDN